MPLQQAFGGFALATQAVKGTPTATAAFAHGVTSGGAFDIQITDELVSATTGGRDFNAVQRTLIKPAFNITSPAYVKSIGAHLKAALAGYSVSGSGPYVHVLTSASTTTIPYLTVWGWVDTYYVQVATAMVDQFELDWSETGVLQMKSSGFGCGLVRSSVAPTITVDDTKGNIFSPVGALLKFDTLTSTPVTARIMSGNIVINNKVSDIADATSVFPADVFPGTREATISLVVQPDDFAYWNAVVTNSTSGTTGSSAVAYGSTEINFNEYGSTGTLKIATPRVSWNITSPTQDPNGGPADVTLSGRILIPSGGTAITATLTNSVVTY